MMIRTQIQLTEKQAEALHEISRRTGTSVAELVRQSVDVYLKSQRQPDREEQVRRALSAMGKYSSGLTDVGAEHDRYLAEDLGE
jgi:hypothetical protein